MSEQDSTIKKAKSKDNKRTERRFVPGRPRRGLLTAGGIVLGGLALGAGTYAQWIAEQPMAASPWIVGAGAAVLVVAILWGELAPPAVRVGDAGIAVEQSSTQLLRLGWSRVRSIGVDKQSLVIGTDAETVRISAAWQPRAVAWVIKQAADRVPKVLSVPNDWLKALPATSDSDGVVMPVEKVQVTGLRCRASGKVITFERDARTCPQCGEVYHQDAMPERCICCNKPMREPPA